MEARPLCIVPPRLARVASTSVPPATPEPGSEFAREKLGEQLNETDKGYGQEEIRSTKCGAGLSFD